jgi:hypothetical protein
MDIMLLGIPYSQQPATQEIQSKNKSFIIINGWYCNIFGSIYNNFINGSN